MVKFTNVRVHTTHVLPETQLMKVLAVVFTPEGAAE